MDSLLEVEKSLLTQWVTNYYRTLQGGVIPTLRGFYEGLQQLVTDNSPEIENLRDHKLFPFEEFFIVLEPFVYGVYADHFNAVSQDYLLDHRLVCFELESVKSNSRLYPLVVQILFDFAFELVSKNPYATKFIDIEEGWTMLDDSSEEHIASFFRKGRKTKTSIRLITQDIEEICASRIAGAMKNNAATFMLLYNDKSSSRNLIGDFLGMNDLDRAKYASMRRREGINGFREIFIKEMNKSHVWLLQTSYIEYALLTSKPHERNRISKCIQEQGDIEEGIAQWIVETKKKQACFI